jgi:hypothetical protein
LFEKRKIDHPSIHHHQIMPTPSIKTSATILISMLAGAALMQAATEFSFAFSRVR